MNIKLDRRALTHFEFTQPRFLKLLPEILSGIDAWQKNICYKQDPARTNKLLCIYTKPTGLGRMRRQHNAMPH
jgi:hypothetical protein